MDHYEALGIAPDASADEIAKAYRRLAVAWHPDKQKSAADRVRAEVRFKVINQAAAVLRDADARREYDAMRVANARSSGDRASGSRDHVKSGAYERARERGTQTAEAYQYDFDGFMQDVFDAARVVAYGDEPWRDRSSKLLPSLAAGFWGWLAVGFVALLFSGIGTVPAGVIYWFVVRPGMGSIKRSFTRDGQFIGVFSLLTGMICIALGVVGLFVGLIALASHR